MKVFHLYALSVGILLTNKLKVYKDRGGMMSTSSAYQNSVPFVHKKKENLMVCKNIFRRLSSICSPHV